jgi:hypothetical protein
MATGMAYWIAFGFLHPWLFQDAFPALTRETTSERAAFVVRLGLYAVFALVLAAINLAGDYAKVRAVVEDRRSMLAALVAALRFLSGNLRAAVSVYLLNTLLVGLVLGAYAFIAPGVGAGGWAVATGLLVGQVYILARLWTKLAFWASEVALFQGRLAHAGYVARREPEWPESPAIEAVKTARV